MKGWNSYLANVNNEISSIFLNLDLKEKAPYNAYPKLTWYWLKMDNPKENGLSSDEDFDSLINHEDQLEKHISGLPLIFVGRVTTQGMRQFYYYTKQEFDFSSSIKGFLGENAPYLFQVGEKTDANWSQYLELLYPTESGIKQILERKHK